MVLNTAPDLIPLDETSERYGGVRRRYFVAIMRRHPDVWHVHKQNRQFRLIHGVIARRAVQHCAVQAARGRVFGRLLGFSLRMREVLEKAAFLHDSYKAEEIRYLRANGKSWDAYDQAQQRARESWEITGLFSQAVMDVAGSVAHESLAAMRLICEQAQNHGLDSLSELQVAMLAMHYLDDIAVNDDWAQPAVDGRNVIDIRTANNAANPDYRILNEEGRTRLREQAVELGLTHLFTQGRTTYEEQCIVGHEVEALLARIIMDRYGVVFEPCDLPVILDNVIRQELSTILALPERKV
jgi:hypothetical protein